MFELYQMTIRLIWERCIPFQKFCDALDFGWTSAGVSTHNDFGHKPLRGEYEIYYMIYEPKRDIDSIFHIMVGEYDMFLEPMFQGCVCRIAANLCIYNRVDFYEYLYKHRLFRNEHKTKLQRLVLEYA